MAWEGGCNLDIWHGNTLSSPSTTSGMWYHLWCPHPGRLIFIWPPGSWWEHQPWCGCLDPPDLSDLNDTDDEVDAVLLSLSNTWSDESEGDWGVATHNPCCLWPQFWSYCSTWPCSCCHAPTGAPPIYWQSLGGWLTGGTSLGYENWMAPMQVEQNEGNQAPLGSMLISGMIRLYITLGDT